jgi:uncharacterized OsmC-like protein
MNASAPSSHTATHRNGIDTAALLETIDAIRENPALGQTRWAVRSAWVGGTRADHHVSGFEIGSRPVERSFVIRSDEPHELCGTNQFPNPQEYLLAALNACMMVGYAAVAATMGITLRSLEVRTTGDIDLRGFLGIDGGVPPGYTSLSQEVRIASDATRERLQELHRVVQATSPNFFNLTHAVPVNSRLTIG